jgi:hypothetical protein
MIGQKKTDFVSFAEKRRFLWKSSSFMITCSHSEEIKFDVFCPICRGKMIFSRNIDEKTIELACLTTSEKHPAIALTIMRRN